MGTAPWIKICANTNLADAQLAAELGADAVGFVFAPSKRQVTVEQVAAITPELPASVEKVGVFHALDAEALVDAVRSAGLTALQLHAGYRPELMQTLNEAFEAHVKLIQVVKVPVDGPVEEAIRELQTALRDPGLFAVLLDAAQGDLSGGLGVRFPWARLASEVGRAREDAPSTMAPKLLVAGGLHAGNVAEAISTLQPDGVDVASGVEAEPGRKSPEKLRAFLAAARGSSTQDQ